MSDETTLESQGRHIRLEPLAPGLWGVILGVVLAGLAPLFGFLIGTILGPGDPGEAINPMFWALFLGIIVGALGLLVAGASGVRLYRHLNATKASAG